MIVNRNPMRWIPATGLSLALFVSCASIGNPSGGPRDEDPPRFVRANPAPGSVNVNRDRISIDFDEIVNVKDAFSNVVISPPSTSVPRVTSQGRRVNIQFTDTLLPNTTYTVDFANAIEDNNEGNKLEGFTYSFSTGPTIDTLQISGMVLSADALEPQQGMLVGVYSNLSDTAFAKLPFDRVAKTDDRGRFSIMGLAPGEYRIYALKDLDNDYHRANPEEAMAFYDFTLSPTSERITASDTIRNLITGEVDTVVSRERTRFLPNDILLRSFESDYKSQFLQKYERVDSTRLSFIFNAPSDSLPQLDLVGIEGFKDWAVLERSAHNDTLTYWLRPQSLVATDSLRISARYLRTDSAQLLSPVTDTLRFFTARPRVKKKAENKKKKEGEPSALDSLPPKPTPLGLSVLSKTTQEVYLPLLFEFATPLESLDTAAIHLESMVDSVWTPLPKEWKAIPAEPYSVRRMKIEYPWEFETEYRLTIDSLAATGIYGLQTDPLEFKFKTKSEEDYSTLSFNITNFVDSVPAFVELVNTSDAPVRRTPVVNGVARFDYVEPGKYYARIYEDFDGDGLYTTGLDGFTTPGASEERRQPDAVYYYPKLLTLKKNWEKTETWAVFDTAVDLMKPEAIKKNKPAADKRKRQNARNNTSGDEEEEEDYFDPTRNPFDPNDTGRRNINRR